ncbi:MAG: hypothetical protein ACOYOE_08955 [Chlorobium sp.]
MLELTRLRQGLYPPKMDGDCWSDAQIVDAVKAPGMIAFLRIGIIATGDIAKWEDDEFLQRQERNLEKKLDWAIDREIFRFRNYQLLMKLAEDEPPQTAVSAGDQEAKSAGTKAEIITDNRKKISDQLFEETLIPIIFEKLENGKYITSKKELYNQIAEPYEFGGDVVRKRFDKEYRPDPEKLREALRKYGNEELIGQIKKIR